MLNGAGRLWFLPMIYTTAEILEAQGLFHQARSRVDAQVEMILWMKHSGIPTDVAREALNTMCKLRDELCLRLIGMKATVKGEISSN